MSLRTTLPNHPDMRVPGPLRFLMLTMKECGMAPVTYENAPDYGRRAGEIRIEGLREYGGKAILTLTDESRDHVMRIANVVRIVEGKPALEVGPTGARFV